MKGRRVGRQEAGHLAQAAPAAVDRIEGHHLPLREYGRASYHVDQLAVADRAFALLPQRLEINATRR